MLFIFTNTTKSLVFHLAKWILWFSSLDFSLYWVTTKINDTFPKNIVYMKWTIDYILNVRHWNLMRHSALSFCVIYASIRCWNINSWDQFIIYINRWGNGTLAYWWVMIWNFVVLSLKLWHDCNVHQMLNTQREYNNVDDDIMT